MTNDFLMFIVTVKRDVSVLMGMHKNVCFKSMFKIFDFFFKYVQVCKTTDLWIILWNSSFSSEKSEMEHGILGLRPFRNRLMGR